MMLKYLSFSIVALTLGLTGCAFSTHVYHVSDNDPVNVGKPATDVVVDAERFVVLGFNFDVTIQTKLTKSSWLLVQKVPSITFILDLALRLASLAIRKGFT